jgi:hypothetical protein
MRDAALWFSGLVLAFLLAVESGYGQPASKEAYPLKAAFLYHFAEFVEWPSTSFPEPASPLVIGVICENAFWNELENTLSGKRIKNHLLIVKPIGSAEEATNGYHLLFISAAEKKHLPELDALRKAGASVLTVSEEVDRFSQSHVMINFVRTKDNKLRFQINDGEARDVHLKISSKLLSLASRPAP